MIVRPGDGADAAERCGGGVDVVELAIDDSWFRDTGPIVVTDGAGGRLALDWVFNCWGDKLAPYDDDATIAARWAATPGSTSAPCRWCSKAARSPSTVPARRSRRRSA